MTPKDLLTNRNFCPMPWAGLMYNVDGKVKNCIRSAGAIGNLNNNSIEEILHGPHNLETQVQMLSNQPAKHCHTCYDLENNKRGFDIISDRIFYIRELKHIPLETYQLDRHDLRAIDVRWSNLCNFACVYCGPEFSSKWSDELKTTMLVPDDQQLAQFKNYVFEHAKNLQHVYLAGGEPLLMRENLELLELLKQKNPHVHLRVNTNLSKTDTKVFEKICEFQHVHWTISVETMHHEFEYVRHGGSWEDFCYNLHKLRKLNHKISFNMLWFLLNYQSIFDCVRYFQNMGFHNNSFIIGALLEPRYLNVRHLPDFMLQSLAHKLQTCINDQPGYLLEDSFKNMLNYITQPFDKDLAGSFKRIMELDQRRGLDSSKIFKDLYQFQKED